MYNGYGVLWLLTPTFNRQRIKRHSIDPDTPFILGIVEDPKELEIVKSLFSYDNLDLWRICTKTNKHTFSYFTCVGSNIKIAKKIIPEWVSLASEFKRNTDVTYVTTNGSLIKPPEKKQP